MPKRAQSFCQYPRCRAIAERGGLCDQHRQQRKAEDFKRFKSRPVVRGTSTGRGYNFRWNKARAAFLSEHPLCQDCERRGLLIAATVVDHIQPHRGDYAVFWDQDNWQPLCATCHGRKTIAEVNARNAKKLVATDR